MQRIFTLVVVLGLVAVPDVSQAAIGYESRGPHPLEGSWRLIGHLAEDDDIIEPVNFEQIKLVTDRGFTWSRVEDGRIVGSAGGRARFGRATYLEIVDYVFNQELAWLLGQRLLFRWKIEDGRWYHIGTIRDGDREVRVAEVWERIR